jgi:hypothetical protein
MTDSAPQKPTTPDGDRATRTVTRISVGVTALVAGLALFGLQKRAPETENEPERAGKAFRGSVTRLTGSAGLEACDPAGQACRKLDRKSAIPAGSRVRTDYRTRAELRLEDGSVLLLDRGTEVTFSAAGRSAKVARGSLIAEIAPRAGEGARFELPGGVVRVTGTKFALRADGNEGSVDVVRGSVALENSSGESVMVRSGEIGRLSSGNPPSVSASPSLADSVAWGEDAFAPVRETSEVHRGLGELVAKKPGESNERRGAVTLTSHSVRVRIAGAVARTEVEEIFTNQTDQVLEGIFRFPLPPDAQIERLALEVDGQLLEGAFVERDRGAAIWRGAIQNAVPKQPKPREEIVWVPGPWRDPALLEWQRGGRFELRIFPIPKRGSRRVVLAYTQTVPAAGGVRRYGYPLAYDPGGSTRVGRFSANIEVRGHDEQRGVHAAGYELKSDRRGDAAGLLFEQADFAPTGDLVVEYALPDRNAELSAFGYRESAGSGGADPSSYVAVALRPKLPRAERDSEQSLALVVDASRSMFGENYRRATELAVKVARELDPSTRISVLACHTECTSLSQDGIEGGASAADAVRRFLDRITPEGASDVVAAARAGYDATGSDPKRTRKVVYIGDGSPTVGPIRPGTIERAVARFADRSRASISTVGVGSDSDPATLRALARGGGGVMLPYAPGRSVAEIAFSVVGSIAGSALSDVSVELPPGMSAVAPATLDNIPAGGEAWLVARLSGDDAQGSVILRGRVGGERFEQRYRLDVSASSARGNAFVPRLFAAARIADLERGGTASAKAEAIELSSRHSVASRYTSLLVLESQAMFKAFGLDNQRRSEIWTGEEETESSSADGMFEVADKEEVGFDDWGSLRAGGAGALGRASGKGMEMREDSSSGPPATAMAPAPMRPAPAPAPAPAEEKFRPAPKKKSAADSPLVLEPETEWAPPPPPRRRMVPMRRVWERFGEIMSDRFTPKAASFDALSSAERLVMGDSPRREDVKKLYVLSMQSADLVQAARVAERWSDKEPLDAEALTARADVAARGAARDTAIRVLGSVIDVRPGDVAAHQRLARLFRWAGRPELACRHTVGISEIKPGDATLLADAVRCARATGESTLADELLSNAETQVRERAEALLSRPRPDEGELKGDLRLEATWDSGADLDLGLIDPDGHRVSWLGAPTRAVISARDVTGMSREGLALRGGKPGEYVVEIVRAAGSGRARGELTVHAAGTTRRLPFVLDGERLSLALVKIGTREKLVPIASGSW